MVYFVNSNIFPEILVIKKSNCGIFTYHLSSDPEKANDVNTGNVVGTDDLSVVFFI